MAFPTAECFATAMNLDACLERYSTQRTPIEALRSGKIKLRELTVIYGSRPVVGWISTWLIALSSMMDFEITDQQRKTTAAILSEDLYMLNLVEITLLFKRLFKGVYGVFYGKFNMQTILIAAREYRQERGKLVQKLSGQELHRLGLL